MKLRLIFLYLVIVLSTTWLLAESEEQQHYFIHKGYLAGVSSFGHLSADIDISAIEEEIKLAETFVARLKKAHNKSDNIRFRTRAKKMAVAIQKRVDLMKFEWLNTKVIFLDNYPGEKSIQSDTLTENGVRVRRFLFTTIALLGGLSATVSGIFSMEALNSLSAARDQDDNEHLIEVLQGHEGRLTLLEDKEFKLNATMIQVIAKVHDAEKMEHLHSVDLLVQSYLGLVEEQVRRFRYGLQGLLDHRITPALLNTNALYDALRRLGRKARQQGYIFPTDTIISSVYMFRTSFLMLENKCLRVFIHIPLMKQGSIMKLFQLLPMPLKLNGTDHHLMIDSVPGLIAVNQNLDGYSILPFSDLKDCNHVANILVCEHHNVLLKRFGDTCLGALYKEDGKRATEVCDFSLHHTRFSVTQVTATHFAVFHPKLEKLRIECPDAAPNVTSFEGNRMVFLKPNCRALNSHYTFTAEQNIGVNLTTQTSSYNINITTLFGEDVDTDDLNKMLRGSDQPLPVRRLREEFHFRKVSTGGFFSALLNPSHWFASISSNLALIGGVILGIVLLRYCCPGCIKCLAWCCKKKTTAVGNNHEMSESQRQSSTTATSPTEQKQERRTLLGRII